MVEENIDSHKDARLTLIEIRYLWWIGNSYVEGVCDLQKTNPGNFVSMELLSSQALEILIKSYLGSKICVENKEKETRCLELILDEMFRSFGHNIKRLLNKDNFLKNELKILDIKKVNNGFVSDYRVTLKNKSVLSFKELESVRYGSFAKNINVVNGPFPKEQTEFLQSLSRFVYNKISDSINLLQKQKTA